MSTRRSLALTSVATTLVAGVLYVVAFWLVGDGGRAGVEAMAAADAAPPATRPEDLFEDPPPKREPLAPGVEPNAPVPEAVTAVEDVRLCWDLDEPGALQACVDAWLAARPFPVAEQELGELVCSVSSGRETGLPEEATYEVTRALMRARAHEDLVASLDSIYAACERQATVGRLNRAVLDLRETDPDLFEHLRASLVSERLFDPTAGVGAVRLAIELATVLQDEDLQAVLREGARGTFGGTDAQVDRATNAAFGQLEPGAESMAFARELAAAPYLADGTPRLHLGSTLAVMSTRRWIAGGCPEGEVVAFLQSVLDDPVLGLGAAAQVVRKMRRDPPPEGFSAESWEGVWTRAQEVVEEAALRW